MGSPALKWGSTNAYTEDANGKPVYDWTIVDGILDTSVNSGAKPFRRNRLYAEGSVAASGSVSATLPAREKRLHRLGLSARPTTTNGMS